MLLPNQLGVNSIGGVEPAICLLYDTISGPNNQGIVDIASLDLSNAFNTLGRRSIATAVAKYAPVFYRATKWAYDLPSLLVTSSGETLASAEGVRQGDPLAALLFSLGLRPTLEHLQHLLPKATIIAYLDDIYVLNRGKEDLLATAARALKDSPVNLNQSKSRQYSVLELQATGFKALGTYIGPLEARRAFLQGKINTLATTLKHLKDLPKQYALLLLRGSIHLLLRHLLRQLDPVGLEDLWAQTDSLIQDTIIAIASRSPGEPLEAFNISLIYLPVRVGGLGIPSYSKLATGLFQATRDAAIPLLAQIEPKGYTKPPDKPPTAQEVLLNVYTDDLEALKAKATQGQHNARLENASYLGRQ